jgi:hypothetical protein
VVGGAGAGFDFNLPLLAQRGDERRAMGSIGGAGGASGGRAGAAASGVHSSEVEAALQARLVLDRPRRDAGRQHASREIADPAGRSPSPGSFESRTGTGRSPPPLPAVHNRSTSGAGAQPAVGARQHHW